MQVHAPTLPKREYLRNTVSVIGRPAAKGHHYGVDAKTCRTAKIRQLVAERGGPTLFAKEVADGRWTQAQVSQWISPTEPKGIGHALARAIEKETGKPAGWLDAMDGPMVQVDVESLRAELEGFSACLRAFAAGMAVHRPAEGADVAAALRAIAGKYPLAQELAGALAPPSAALRAR